jgi:hypothetical protein
MSRTDGLVLDIRAGAPAKARVNGPLHNEWQVTITFRKVTGPAADTSLVTIVNYP